MVRYRIERKGFRFYHSISRKINYFIIQNQLIDLKLSYRYFTWYNMRISPFFALLDRFLRSITWESEFPLYSSKSLARYQSDHNVPILNSNQTNTNRSQTITMF
jgi:hypothetical protein